MEDHDGRRLSRRPWALLCLLLLSAAPLFTPAPAPAQGQPPAAEQPKIAVVKDASGSRLQVGGRDFLVRGMNWDYIPIGHNYSFDLWAQPEDVITTALDREMSLLQTMGVNAIRQGAGIPPRWVQYIYERYGIFTVINDVMGRYGLTVNGIWRPVTDYSDLVVRKMLIAQIAAVLVERRSQPDDSPAQLAFTVADIDLRRPTFRIPAADRRCRN